MHVGTAGTGAAGVVRSTTHWWMLMVTRPRYAWQGCILILTAPCGPYMIAVKISLNHLKTILKSLNYLIPLASGERGADCNHRQCKLSLKPCVDNFRPRQRRFWLILLDTTVSVHMGFFYCPESSVFLGGFRKVISRPNLDI